MTGLTNPERIVVWILEHGEDPGIDDPIPKIKIQNPASAATHALRTAIKNAEEALAKMSNKRSDATSKSDASSSNSSSSMNRGCKFEVGSEVMLAPNYSEIGDASAGPLTPSDVGEVIKVAVSAGVPRCQVKVKQSTGSSIEVLYILYTHVCICSHLVPCCTLFFSPFLFILKNKTNHDLTFIIHMRAHMFTCSL
jgi:hypothetical protein